MKTPIYFGPFLVTSQVFYLTPLSFALVNLRPILPGHVLICPQRRGVARVADLTPAEASDLFLTARRVGRMVERVFGASSLNIAIQDGADAGQSVPHVHAHVIPRLHADLDSHGGTDAIYDLLDGDEGDLNLIHRNEGSRRTRSRFPIDDKLSRCRSKEEMATEAEMLAKEMENEPED